VAALAFVLDPSHGVGYGLMDAPRLQRLIHPFRYLRDTAVTLSLS
jgi:hypothetical protein